MQSEIAIYPQNCQNRQKKEAFNNLVSLTSKPLTAKLCRIITGFMVQFWKGDSIVKTISKRSSQL